MTIEPRGGFLLPRGFFVDGAGVLIDVFATAMVAGFKYPVALTAAAWGKCVAVPSGVVCQDEAGRLWDVDAMLRFATRGSNGGRVRSRRTGEEKYFISNAAAAEPVERIVRAAFCRWNVEHGVRLSKGEIGFRHFEGRSYVALLRHLVPCCATLTFVPVRRRGCGGKNPEVTAEQVCRGLNLVCRGWLDRLRGTTPLEYTSAVICYHQRRNRAARESRHRPQRGLPGEYRRAASRRTRRRPKRRCQRQRNQAP